jgi:hypothetical protein
MRVRHFRCRGHQVRGKTVSVGCHRRKHHHRHRIWFRWSPSLPVSPPGAIMSVNQNLKESLPTPYDNILGAGHPDLEYNGELTNFAQRISHRLSEAPDVLIFQEVLRRTEWLTAKDLTRVLGYHYVPLVLPWRQNLNDKLNASHTKMIKWNTGIVINAQTLRATSRAGYLSFRQKWADAMAHCPTSTPPHPKCIQGEKLAYGVAVERSTGNRVGMFDIHFLPNHKFSSIRAGNRARTRWSRRIVRFMNTKLTGTSVKVIAGEFDQNRCWGGEPETHACSEKPFYRAYTNGGFTDGVVQTNPTDAQLAMATGARIDFCFSRPRPVFDHRDMAYDIMKRKHGGNPNYISDHRMEWWKVKV